jgi:urease accessory protein
MFDVARSCDRTGGFELLVPPSGRHEGASDRDMPRANGVGRLVLGSFGEETRINELFQRAPIRIMFPKFGTTTAPEEAVLINTAGGIAGGDRLDYAITALANASIAVTSQAAEKVHRSLDEPSRIRTRLGVFGAARLAWLPQETIVFNRAFINRQTEIEISSKAQLLALEWLVLGRAAHGEEFVDGCIVDSWRVKRDGRLIWADTFRANKQAISQFHRTALLFDCRAIGTLIYFGPEAAARLATLREIAPQLGCQCAVTAVAGLIIARFAARVSADMRRAVRGVLEQFKQQSGSGPFRTPKMWSC